MVNQFLSLSMFVMLLAFFIVLSSFSEFEQVKSKAVLGSITVAFSQQEERDEIQPSLAQNLMQSSGRGSALDTIDALFRSHIVGVKASKNRMGTQMQISLPVKEFENLLNGTLTYSSETNLLPLLVSLLDAQDTIAYRMDIVMNVAESPSRIYNERPQVLEADMKKAAGYAQKLEKTGLPRKLVTAGVAQGKVGMVDLIFRPYAAFNPVENQEGAVPAEGGDNSSVSPGVQGGSNE